MRYYEVIYDGEDTMIKARSREDAIARYCEDHIWLNHSIGITAREISKEEARRMSA